MTRSDAPTEVSRRPASGAWLRWGAIAVGALLLASCRSMPTSVALPAAALTAAVQAEAAHVESGPGDAPPAATAVADGTRADADAADTPTAPGGAMPGAAIRDAAVRPVGLEAPSPPLPRLVSPAGPVAMPVAGPTAAACRGPECGGCRAPQCRLHVRPLLGRHAGGCRGGDCPDGACAPIVPTVAIPVIGPCLVCDGGDHGRPALPRGRTGFRNVTSGDTVARYRADGPGPAPATDDCLEAESCVVASNCTCVYAPRFSSVRKVTRPFEDAVPTGPQGVVLDTLAEAETAGLGVRDKTQQTQLVAARLAQPGIAIEDRIPVLAVDKVQPPYLGEGVDGPAARVLDVPVERVHNVQSPRLARRIDVPLAWMCVSAAQVTVNGEAADVLAVDHGVATLRLESPGRCELTLCKRAGSDTARPGEELDFTICLLNSGDRPLTDISLVDAVPGRLQVIAGSAVSNLPADISTAKGEDGSTLLTWAFKGTLEPGQSGFVRFRTIVH